MTSNEEDRVVSRRVENPTRAEPGDERVYRAADPAPGGDPVDAPRGPTGGAGRGTSPDDESEPTRSE
ncbi:MAG TPA: hypothetical protein VD903_05745 [Pseudonocardia sp.]|nr:hypothetical protein [Pseudonocardia sp.]